MYNFTHAEPFKYFGSLRTQSKVTLERNMGLGSFMTPIHFTGEKYNLPGTGNEARLKIKSS